METLQLPKHILKALVDNKTSLGDHPAFPPEEEEKFIVSAVADVFTEFMGDKEIPDVDACKKELGRLISQCQEIEAKSKDALQQLCMDVLAEMFDIPENTVDIDLQLVGEVKTDDQRLIPEKTDDFTFDNITDMKELTEEIYKRRLLNSLIQGCALYYSDNVSRYVKELFDINPELPYLYKKISSLNNILLFLEKGTSKDATAGGRVDVMMGNPDTQVKIEAKGITFPALLNEAIRGILELAIAHGLPDDLKKAEYVIKKADFKLAELWDLRLGIALWKRIMTLEDGNYAKPNYLLMSLSEMQPSEFNETLQEIFAHTTAGKELLQDIVDAINDSIEQDDFDDFIKKSNDEYQITDSEEGYFTPEELLTDSEQFI